MKHEKPIVILVLCVVTLSMAATLVGILTNLGNGEEYEIESIRDQIVTIYGKGIYEHMSSDVAIQGIAQDYVSLFAGIPLLLVSLYLCRKGLTKGGFLLAGTLGYFLVTYLFYTCMAMYNVLFLLYVALTATSFFAFTLVTLSFQIQHLSSCFDHKFPKKFLGGFLIFDSIAIGLMWFSVIVPPLADGTIYPSDLDHYTTLIVQGLDLSLLLPIAFMAGLLLLKNKPFGYLMAPIYIVFLSILMTALTAKVIAMTLSEVSAGPAIVIIPVFNVIAIVCSVLVIKSIKNYENEKHTTACIG